MLRRLVLTVSTYIDSSGLNGSFLHVQISPTYVEGPGEEYNWVKASRTVIIGFKEA